MRTIVHCSDLHFGRIDEDVVEGLTFEVQALKPDVIIVSGDLTQRARASQFAQAQKFLSQLKIPQVVIPGNHDVPLFNIYARFFTPFNHYKRWIRQQTDASFTDNEISIAAINTAHSWTIDAGKLKTDALKTVEKQWSGLPQNVLRILVSHHPLDLETSRQKFTLGRSTIAAHRAWLCKPDILCSGHLHLTAAYAQKGCVQIAAGTATSTRLRNETNSFNVIRTDQNQISVSARFWGKSKFEIKNEQIFKKSQNGWNELF